MAARGVYRGGAKASLKVATALPAPRYNRSVPEQGGWSQQEIMKSMVSRNRTITLSAEEKETYRRRLIKLSTPSELKSILGKTINQDLFDILGYLPESFADLLFIDPPYNLTKSFNATTFRSRSGEEYREWLETWLPPLVKCLKPTASVYMCGDWRSSSAIYEVVSKYLVVRNRITWEREKGRGAKNNWKNNSEDIWFCTVSDDYTFNVDAVRLKRQVIAPYTDHNGDPKDWERTGDGNFRLTAPSNIWTDITVPFWSMPENTSHPTQKPEKLVAKTVLASTSPGDIVIDPFLGSGTTSVVCKKLGRQYIGVELDFDYCCLAEKRLEMAEIYPGIQGYEDGVFWERNTMQLQRKQTKKQEEEIDLKVIQHPLI